MFNNPLVDARGYANSVFADSQQYGFFMGVLAAIPLYTLYMLGANRLSHLLVTILLMLAVLLGGVRSGWVMFAWALIPYFYLTYIKPAKRPIVPMVVVPAFFAAVIMSIVSSSTLVKQQIVHSQGLLSGDVQQVSAATSGYADLWHAATGVVGQHIVNGVGVNNFLPAFMQSKTFVSTAIDVSYPHHVWLEVAASTGLIGLLGLLFVYAAIWRLWRLATPEQQKLALPMLIPALVLWWPINVHHSFYSVQLASLTLFFLAFSIAALTYRGDMK
jgi:O-antigen ligase